MCNWTHVLMLQMRSTNSYVWSDWSESEIIGLDSQCLSATITPLKENSESPSHIICSLQYITHVIMWSQPFKFFNIYYRCLHECKCIKLSLLRCAGVSIFFQRVGEGAMRIAELSCDSSRDPMPHSISDKLYNLEQRLIMICHLSHY